MIKNANSVVFLCTLIPTIALLTDLILGEVTRFHPLVGFGNLSSYIEKQTLKLRVNKKLVGGVAWCLAVFPLCVCCYLLLQFSEGYPRLYFTLNVLFLYLTLGCKSLLWHSKQIYLARNDLRLARSRVAMIVSRNSEDMDERQISSAAIESVLENGNDAIIGTLFWFALLGAPGALLFRLANTLDAMWGYKNSRYHEFGYIAAKVDDALGYIPARISALLYSIGGNIRLGFYCWETQARLCKSPNGGAAMCAGAGALNISIGGPAYYDGQLQDKIYMGVGEIATFSDIPRANRLVLKSSLIFALLLTLVNIVAL